MIEMCLRYVLALSGIHMKDDGVPPCLRARFLQKLHDKGRVNGNGRGEDERLEISFRSPKGEETTMYAYGSETLENVRDRLPIDPELGPYMKRDVVLSKQMPLNITLDALNIQHGDTLRVSGANGLCCEKLFAPSPGIFRLV